MITTAHTATLTPTAATHTAALNQSWSSCSARSSNQSLTRTPLSAAPPR